MESHRKPNGKVVGTLYTQHLFILFFSQFMFEEKYQIILYFPPCYESLEIFAKLS